MYASEVATWRADTSFHGQTTVVESNLLLLSSPILHVYCRNPKWSKIQAVYCLWQLTHLVILVLKPLIPAGYCKTAATSQVETHSTSNDTFISIVAIDKKHKYFKFGFTSIVGKKQWSHGVFCATLFFVLMLNLWNVESSYSIKSQSLPTCHSIPVLNQLLIKITYLW